ncbi:MAG: cyclic 2,3-diphosphoglycerate synthase [Actinomycetota bacterium]|nr:cyclic 2,3-diphosphoglycerate synthase [Actinomycetota bacterium]
MIEGALDELRGRGHEVLAAVLAGGKEKLPAGGLDKLAGTKLVVDDDPRRALDTALTRFEPDAVMDLSDEPVLDYRKRHELASIALARGVIYQGSDFEFRPPPRPHLATKPSIAVVATGKRTGKTAVSSFIARTLVESGRHPVIVAMGRGGPAEPEVMRGDQASLDPHELLAMADQGKHAASDFIEDALLAGVPTVGCRRCGGGMAGAVDISNVPQGVEMANDLPGDILIFEGSGAAFPPVHADVTVLVVPASVPPEFVGGYMGPYRLLLADFAVVTMSENPFGSPSQVSTLSSLIRNAFRIDRGGSPKEIEVVRTVFRPEPTEPVVGRDVFVTTTAPEAVGDSLREHLEDEHKCRVVGISHALSDRAKLTHDLAGLKEADTLLTEIKAAGIDVATRAALEAGLKVVYLDNVPNGVEQDDPAGMAIKAAQLADERFDG